MPISEEELLRRHARLLAERALGESYRLEVAQSVLLCSQRAELRDDPVVRVRFDAVCDWLFAMRYAPSANFTSQANDAFISMGAFVKGVLFIESEGDELRYRSVHISEVCIAENAHGLVDGDDTSPLAKRWVVRLHPTSTNSRTQTGGTGPHTGIHRPAGKRAHRMADRTADG